MNTLSTLLYYIYVIPLGFVVGVIQDFTERFSVIKILEIQVNVDDCYYAAGIVDKLRVAGMSVNKIYNDRPGRVIGKCYSPKLSDIARLMGVESVKVINSTPCNLKRLEK